VNVLNLFLRPLGTRSVFERCSVSFFNFAVWRTVSDSTHDQSNVQYQIQWDHVEGTKGCGIKHLWRPLLLKTLVHRNTLARKDRQLISCRWSFLGRTVLSFLESEQELKDLRCETLRTIIWYKRACIRRTTRRLSIAVPPSQKDVNKSVVIEQVPN